VAFDDAGDYSRAAKRLPSITTAAFRMVLASGFDEPNSACCTAESKMAPT
jgi:hypothetical protein